MDRNHLVVSYKLGDHSSEEELRKWNQQTKKTTLFRARLAEWSNALDLRSSLFGGEGSNPSSGNELLTFFINMYFQILINIVIKAI